ILIGLSFGALIEPLNFMFRFFRLRPTGLSGGSLDTLVHPTLIVQQWGLEAFDAMLVGLLPAFIFSLVRAVIKRTWVAGILAAVVMMLLLNNGAFLTAGWQQRLFLVFQASTITYATIRFGLLAMAASAFGWGLLGSIPFTSSFGAWYSTPTLFTLA